MVTPTQRRPARRAAQPEVDTRERILLAARRIFAERGFEAATLREITDAAEANLAAVNYYFRSKEELVRCVLEAALEPVIAARLGALEACERMADGAHPSLAALTDALVRPLAELSSGENREIMLLILHVRTTQHEFTGRIMREQFAPLHERFVDALARVLPHLSRREIALRYDCARGAALQTLVALAPASVLVSRLENPPEGNDLVTMLCTFIEAGFAASGAPPRQP